MFGNMSDLFGGKQEVMPCDSAGRWAFFDCRSRDSQSRSPGIPLTLSLASLWARTPHSRIHQRVAMPRKG
jgi:hypothetical protein